MVGNYIKFIIFVVKVCTMIELPYTADNIAIVQKFLRETKERISNGVEITFTGK